MLLVSSPSPFWIPSWQDMAAIASLMAFISSSLDVSGGGTIPSSLCSSVGKRMMCGCSDNELASSDSVLPSASLLAPPSCWSLLWSSIVSTEDRMNVMKRIKGARRRRVWSTNNRTPWYPRHWCNCEQGLHWNELLIRTRYEVWLVSWTTGTAFGHSILFWTRANSSTLVLYW